MNASKRSVITQVDLFDNHGVSNEQIKAYTDLYWATTTHDVDTRKYHKMFTTVPVNTYALNNERDTTKMKIIILRKTNII